MRVKARIYLKRLTNDVPVYLGEREVEPVPTLNSVVRYSANGRTETGLVQRMSPPGVGTVLSVRPGTLRVA